MLQAAMQSNLDREFGALAEFWSPRVVAVANGQHIKVAKVRGEFVWHAHANEAEFFLVRKGTLLIRYRDRADVVLGEGDFHVVPRGVEHTTAAPQDGWVVLFEPATTEHAGERQHALSVSIERQPAHLSAAPQQPRAQET